MIILDSTVSGYDKNKSAAFWAYQGGFFRA